MENSNVLYRIEPSVEIEELTSKVALLPVVDGSAAKIITFYYHKPSALLELIVVRVDSETLETRCGGVPITEQVYNRLVQRVAISSMRIIEAAGLVRAADCN